VDARRAITAAKGKILVKEKAAAKPPKTAAKERMAALREERFSPLWK
jgi:hypothetical protein